MTTTWNNNESPGTYVLMSWRRCEIVKSEHEIIIRRVKEKQTFPRSSNFKSFLSL